MADWYPPPVSGDYDPPAPSIFRRRIAQLEPTAEVDRPVGYDPPPPLRLAADDD
jgi:hypothetical protein